MWSLAESCAGIAVRTAIIPTSLHQQQLPRMVLTAYRERCCDFLAERFERFRVA